MTLSCGVDVGGTKISGGVVDEDGAVVEELRVAGARVDDDGVLRVRFEDPARRTAPRTAAREKVT